MSEYENILVETEDRVGIITLNRPEALNALNSAVMLEVVAACRDFDADAGIGAIVIIGAGEKAFAAGADIKEMAELGYSEMNVTDHFAEWDDMRRVRTPIITAVRGYALGGGCELAMMGDILIAADDARFGQPEITLGVIPGMGGTQRLTRAIGKAKAMDLVLSGRFMDAEEAERAGLVARIVPAAELLAEAKKLAAKVASMPLQASMIAAEAVDRAFETTLSEGLFFERRVFHALFATEDQKEGMAAFVEKRKPEWKR